MLGAFVRLSTLVSLKPLTVEFKVIVYIVIGVLYFLYSLGKKAQEKEKAAPKKPAAPASPDAPNPLDEILQEIKRKQAELERQQNSPKKPPVTPQKPKPQPLQKPKPKPAQAIKTGKDVLLHEKRASFYEEGVTNAFSSYERELTAEEKIERGTLYLENEGAYKTESIMEMEAREKQEMEDSKFIFEPRDAIISSIVLERKF